jgi:D-alanyl-D-alanine carboxypeptidase
MAVTAAMCLGGIAALLGSFEFAASGERALEAARRRASIPPYSFELRRARGAAAGLPEAAFALVRAEPERFFALLRMAEALDDGALFAPVDRARPLPGGAPENLQAVPRELLHPDEGDTRLRADALEALAGMAAAAARDGVRLAIISAYRTFAESEAIMKSMSASRGEETARRLVAPPGASQHHLGTAVDFSSPTYPFSSSAEARWLGEHAWKFGFSLSYPWGAEALTGYMPEAWHYRYVGIAMCIVQREYFGDMQAYALEFFDRWKRCALFGKPAPKPPAWDAPFDDSPLGNAPPLRPTGR